VEALELFERLCGSNNFADSTSFVLVLNKLDRFQAKLPSSPLSALWPDYDDGCTETALKFVENKFLEKRGARDTSPFMVRARWTATSVAHVWPWGILRDHAAHRSQFPLQLLAADKLQATAKSSGWVGLTLSPFRLLVKPLRTLTDVAGRDQSLGCSCSIC
jgi:hypothetical protein